MYQALQIKFSIVRHVFAKYLRMRFVCVRHTRVRAFLQNSGQSNHAQYTNMVQQCCVTCQDIAPVVCSSHLVFSRACSQHQNSIPRTGPGASACTQHGTCAAGLPGICDVNLVCRTMDDDISVSARSRGIVIRPQRRAQRAKRTSILMADASHSVAKPAPRSAA